MHEYIVTFWCDGDVSDIYVHANNEADAIELASYGIEGVPRDDHRCAYWKSTLHS